MNWPPDLGSCFYVLAKLKWKQFLICFANPLIINDANTGLFFFFGGGGGEQKCLYKNKTCVTVVWRFVSLVTVQCENKHGPLRWCLKSCWVDQTLFTLFSSRLLYVLVVTLRLENMFFFASHKLPFGSSWPNWGREPLCARQECSQGQHYIILEVALDYAAHFSALLSNKYCYFIHRISKYP